MRDNESKITCDKCGESDKVKWIETRLIIGGRYCEISKGWAKVRNKDVCPKCAKKLGKIIKEFLK